MTARTYALLAVTALLVTVLALIVMAPETAPEQWTPATQGDAVPFQGEMPHG